MTGYHGGQEGARHPLRDRFSIEVEGGEDMEAKGNIADHEDKIERGGDKVAEVSRSPLR